MEGISNYITVHDKECRGCIKYNEDIMISFTIEDTDDIHDIFLMQEQAIFLIERLTSKVRYNDNIC